VKVSGIISKRIENWKKTYMVVCRYPGVFCSYEAILKGQYHVRVGYFR